MKQKVFKIIIKHSRTSIQDSPTQKLGSAIKNSLAIDFCEESWFSGRRAQFFLQLTTISRFVVCGLHILLSSARMYFIYVIFLCRTSLNLCPLMYCVEPKRIASSLHRGSPFLHMQPGFFILISLLLDSSIRKLHGRQSKYFMEDIPASKRARQCLWKTVSCLVCI